MTRVGAIVVNYRSAGLVRDLLASVAEHGPGWIHSLVVVDNASPDGSMRDLENAVDSLGLSRLVSVVQAGRNAGFGAGNNVGAQRLLRREDPPDILWFLNPDTVVKRTDLAPALRHFREDAAVGIVGTGLDNGQGGRELGSHRDLGPMSEFVRNAGTLVVLRRFSASDPALERSGAADWVSGASMLVRAPAFERVGGFDEGFFLYFEEVDLCVRCRRAGWAVRYEPATRVVHLEGQTTGARAGRPRPSYWYESRRRLFLKTLGGSGLLLADAAWALGRAVGRLRGRPSDGCTWRDLWRCDRDAILGDGLPPEGSMPGAGRA